MEQDQGPDDSPQPKQRPGTFGSFSWILTQVLVFSLVISAVFSVYARQHWLADLVANLRIQLVIGLATAFFLCLIHRQSKAITIVAMITAWQIPWFAYPSHNSDTGSSLGNPILTVSFANVQSTNQRYDDIVADLTRRNPDLIVVLELSSKLADQLKKELIGEFPFMVTRSQNVGNFGIGLFSKYPLKNQEVFELNVPIESIAATVVVNDTDYRIFATHPLPPMGARAFEDRNLHLKQLANRIKRFQGQSPQTPVVLVGDLNLTPWTPLFTDLERASGLARAGERFDVRPTWYQRPGFPFGLVLDHGLISEDLRCVSRRVGPDIGSDHRSVTLVLAPRE